jgi:hypothetical protein
MTIHTANERPPEAEDLAQLYAQALGQVDDFRGRTFDLPRNAVTWMSGGCFDAALEQQLIKKD